jgi:hypothetical protein
MSTTMRRVIPPASIAWVPLLQLVTAYIGRHVLDFSVDRPGHRARLRICVVHAQGDLTLGRDAVPVGQVHVDRLGGGIVDEDGAEQDA